MTLGCKYNPATIMKMRSERRGDAQCYFHALFSVRKWRMLPEDYLALSELSIPNYHAVLFASGPPKGTGQTSDRPILRSPW